MVKEGAAVVDIGIKVRDDGSITGDVDFESVEKRASFITPVPGGVGPVTIAMLLENTVRSATLNELLKSPLTPE
jgi:methylenetetrahydrofolate dehydrogenase (NADP+)/methenyltetrahydrofolate cyclohydrolase